MKPPTARSPCRSPWRTKAVIHLLLTDVIMPGMNGRELAQRISEIRPNVKILYMSGYTENVIGHNGMLDAGVRLLQKPFNLRDLKSKVREVLDATPTPPEVAMSTQSAERHQPRRPRKFPRPRATIPTALASALSPPRREGVARGQDRKHQPLRHALRSRRGAAAELAQLEINLVLPAEIAGLSATEVVCRGEVVRTVEPNGQDPDPGLAARILQYHFQHGPLPRA